MRRTVGAIVLGLSACGYPLTQLAARRWGVRGVAVAESVCAGLAIRDASMVASGVPDRLRPVPAALPRLELAASVVAVLAGSPPLVNVRRAGREPTRADTVDIGWCAAVATLFPVHTIRFGISLRPDRGFRQAQSEMSPAPAIVARSDGWHRSVPGCARRQPR
jgi:hypothetical protein